MKKFFLVMIAVALLCSLTFAESKTASVLNPDTTLNGLVKNPPKLGSTMVDPTKVQTRGSAASSREAKLFSLGSAMQMVSLGYEIGINDWVEQYLPAVRQDLLKLGVSQEGVAPISGTSAPGSNAWFEYQKAIITATEKDKDTLVMIYAGMWVTKMGVLSLIASASNDNSLADTYTHFKLDLAGDFQKIFATNPKVSQIFDELASYNGQRSFTKTNYARIAKLADQILDELSAT